MGKYLIKSSESVDKKVCEPRRLVFGKEEEEEEEEELEEVVSEDSAVRVLTNEGGRVTIDDRIVASSCGGGGGGGGGSEFSQKPRFLNLNLYPSIILVIMFVMTMRITAASPAPSLNDHNDHTIPDPDKKLMDSRELDKIRESIMMDLGLRSVPDPSKANVSQTEYENAHREYLKRVKLSSGQDQRTRRKLHVYYPADPVFGHNTTFDFASHSTYFPIEIKSFDNHAVDHSTFRFLLGSDRDHDILEVSVYQPTRLSRRLIARRSIPLAQSAPRWVEFDSTEAVASWVHDGEENLGLHVEVRGSDGAVRWTESGPSALNVFTVSEVRPRSRRSIPEELMSLHRGRKTECKGQNKKCCRHQMTVIFKDLKGFEFIIQPKDFDAGYCKGRCPPRYNPAHHHALLQSLIWKEDRKKAPRPCCAPSKLTELEILYFDENDPGKLKVSNWKNMKVLECACS